MGETTTVVIDRLGAQGDGVADTSTGPVFVPGALPGETWAVDSESATCLSPSPDRKTPICTHFDACGGCMAQHMPDDVYVYWKRDRLKAAMARQGLDVVIQPLQSVGIHARRRATFSYQATPSGLVFGYHRASSHDIVDIDQCPILMPDITRRLNALRACAGVLAVPNDTGRASVTVVEGGLHVSIAQAGVQLSPEQRQKLSACAQANGLLHLVVNDDPIVTLKDAVIDLPGGQVVLAQPTFLQATPAAERIIAPLLQKATAKAKHTADLFSGLGTFSLLLAKTSRVAAFDSDAGAISALRRAAKNNQGLKPIDVKRRDLFREPLSRRELKAFDTVVINPPRAGADAQCQRLATSQVQTIAMIACDPVTFARDAKALTNGGYKIETILPIDQFVYSEHVEVVATFRKPKRRSTS